MIKNKKIFKKKKAARDILLAAAIFVLIASVYTWQTLLLPQKEMINTLKNTYSLERQRIGAVGLFARTYPDSESYLKELDGKLSILENMLPNNPYISDFLLETEETSRTAGVAIVEVRPLPEVMKDGYKEFPIEMTVKGNFEEILDFHQRLENSRRFTSVTSSTTLIKDDNQTDKSEPELESKIIFVIYAKI